MLWTDAATCAGLAALVAAALFWIRLRDALGTDEAYLWYGVLRLLEGRLPHRDFRSYEPGRYVWCAAWALLFGRGLAVVRGATHGFYAAGLTAGLLGLRSLGLDVSALALTAVLLGTWAHPQHKLFEPALMMFGFASSVWLLVAASPVAATVAGAAVGGSLFFGFNYFLYLGAGLALTWLAAWTTGFGPPSSSLLAWVALGVAVGAAPFAILLCVPGFGVAFFERRVRSILHRGASNLPLPIPWPWRPVPPQLFGMPRARQRAFQFLFLALVAVPPAVLLMAFAVDAPASRAWSGVIAAAGLAATGWHHASSRADFPHLAQSMAPLLLLASSLLALTPRCEIGGLVLLIGVSLAMTWKMYPVVERHAAPAQFAPVRMGGLQVWTPIAQCRVIECAAELGRRELAEGGTFVALPTLVALYPILGRVSPIYDIFSVFPASDAEQDRMIRSIDGSDVRLAFVSNAMLDGREALRFSATHPRVWAYLHATMQVVEGLDVPPEIYVFRLRGSRGDAASG